MTKPRKFIATFEAPVHHALKTYAASIEVSMVKTVNEAVKIYLTAAGAMMDAEIGVEKNVIRK